MRISKMITSVAAASALTLATVASAAPAGGPAPLVASADADGDNVVGLAFNVIVLVGLQVVTLAVVVTQVTKSH